MTEVQLVWPNKHRVLCALGHTDYQWVDENDRILSAPRHFEMLTAGALNSKSNLLVLGDGLDAVHALTTHKHVLNGGIRLVYVDPPFNTNADVHRYDDAMDRSMWLSMMRNRLMALKPLLSSDASVWVHLDDAEVHRARLVMDEVFGEGAFVASVIWQKKNTRDSRAAFSTNHDTVLVYAPSGPKKWKTSRNLLAKDAALVANRDNDPRGPWTDAPFTAPGFRSGQQYEIVTPTGRVLRPPRGRSWYATEPTYQNLLSDGRIWFPREGNGSPRLKLFSHQLRGLVPFTIWGSTDTGTNDDAKRHLMALFRDQEVFDTPKPELLLERIIHIATNPGDLVVDIFGGSGTTAATAHKMRRRWITAERSFKTILDCLLPRLQRVVNGTDPGGITQTVGWTGGGSFKVAYVAPRLGEAHGSEVLEAIRQRATQNARCEDKQAVA